MSRGKRERRRVARDVRELCERIVGNLRALLKREGPRILEQFPNGARPCHTCAFQPSTDSYQGFDATVLGLAHAIVHDKPFYCHEPMPRDVDGNWMFDPRVAKLCAGWGMLAGAAADAKRAVVCGFVGQSLSDVRADWMLEFIQDSLPCPQQRTVAPGVTERELKPYR